MQKLKEACKNSNELNAQAVACFLEAVRCCSDSRSLLKLSDCLLSLRQPNTVEGLQRLLTVFELKAIR